MRGCQPDIEFKDYVFISRLKSVHQAPNTLSAPQLKVSRSTWTRKVTRQIQNQRKLDSFHTIFQESHTHVSNSPVQSHRYSIQTRAVHKNNTPHTKYPKEKTVVFQRRKTPLKTHFLVNRNMSTGDNPHDLTDSGILFQKLAEDSLPASRHNGKTSEQRLFLKTLKIKSNVNLYKGNFSKFTKKELARRNKSKHPTNDIDVSPWDYDSNRNYLA